MAIYSTFFLCDPANLPRLFPGWRPPRPEPLLREVKNPFTGELMNVVSREPDWSDYNGEDEFEPNYQVVAIEGDYSQYLEGRLPRGIGDLPHWCAKGLTEVELSPLGESAGIEPALEVALYAPPSFAATLDQFHAGLLLELATAEDRRLEEIATGWAAIMSTPDYTHSVSGEKLEEGWPPDYALSILQMIVALAQQASNKQRLYLLTEA